MPPQHWAAISTPVQTENARGPLNCCGDRRQRHEGEHLHQGGVFQTASSGRRQGQSFAEHQFLRFQAAVTYAAFSNQADHRGPDV